MRGASRTGPHRWSPGRRPRPPDPDL